MDNPNCGILFSRPFYLFICTMNFSVRGPPKRESFGCVQPRVVRVHVAGWPSPCNVAKKCWQRRRQRRSSARLCSLHHHYTEISVSWYPGWAFRLRRPFFGSTFGTYLAAALGSANPPRGIFSPLERIDSSRCSSLVVVVVAVATTDSCISTFVTRNGRATCTARRRAGLHSA
jgi:hypothetical protein